MTQEITTVWKLDDDDSKCHYLLQDPEVLPQVEALHAEIQARLKAEGFDVGDCSASLSLKIDSATSWVMYPIKDLYRGVSAQIGAEYTLNESGEVRTYLVVYRGRVLLPNGEFDMDAPYAFEALADWSTLHGSINWKKATISRTEFSRHIMVDQLIQRDFLNSDKILSSDTMQELFDLLVY